MTSHHYSLGCRCDACRAEHAAYQRHYRARRRKLEINLRHLINPLRHHVRTGEPVCDPCLDVIAYAERVKHREYLQRYRVATQEAA